MPLTEADRLGIMALQAKFIFCLDQGDPQGWTDTFAPDGFFVDRRHRLQGPKEILPFISDLMTTGDAGPNAVPRLLHFQAPPLIEGDGDHATSRCYWQVLLQGKDGSCVTWRVGEFIDTLVKVDGKWLFAERQVPGLLGTHTLTEL